MDINYKAIVELIAKAFVAGFVVTVASFFLMGGSVAEFFVLDKLKNLLVKALDGGIYAAAGILMQNPFFSSLKTIRSTVVTTVVKPVSIIVLLMLTSCVSLREGAQNSQPWIRPVVATATTAVFQLSHGDAQDLSEKKDIVRKLAAVLESLTKGALPSVAQFEDAISLAAPDKAHWANLTAHLSGLYSREFTRLNGDPKLCLEVISEIAGGLKEGVQ